MFDALIREISQRFGLGDKGQALIAQLLGAIFDPNSGGISGLLARFRQQGLGDLFSSWLGNTSGQGAAPTQEQTEAVLGAGKIGEIADKLGVARGTVAAAASAALPRIIGALTPNGQLPSGIPASISGILGGLGGLGGSAASAVTGSVSAAAGRAAGAANQAAAAAEDAAGSLGWLKWLVLAAIVLALGYCMLNRKPAAPQTAAPPAPAAETRPAPTPPPAPTADAHLSLANDAGKLAYSGVVGSAAEQDQIVSAIKSVFGDAASGEVKVDANTKAAPWLAGLAGLLPAFKLPGAHLDFDGNAANLSGTLSEADKQSLSNALRSGFGGFNFNGLAPLDAAGALSALAPGKFSADDLIKALNLMIIHFNTGSAVISADSLEILGKAATALKAAPAGTKVEVGGHTDNTGNADANMKLSDARANAVRSKLAELGVAADSLNAKGYGDTKPVADNASEEGRAKNRRIEFTVTH